MQHQSGACSGSFSPHEAGSTQQDVCSISLLQIYVPLRHAPSRSGSTEYFIRSNTDQKEVHQEAALSELASPLAPHCACLARCIACCSLPKAQSQDHSASHPLRSC